MRCQTHRPAARADLIAGVESYQARPAGSPREHRGHWIKMEADLTALDQREPWRRLAGGGLGQSSPANSRLNVSDPLAFEVDLDLVLLDIPVADGGDPSERALTARHDSLAPIDDSPDLTRRQPLLLLGIAAAEPQRLFIVRLAWPDPLERLRRRDGPPRPPPGFPAAHVDARPEHPGQSPHDRGDERAREIPESKQERREEDWAPGKLPAKVS